MVAMAGITVIFHMTGFPVIWSIIYLHAGADTGIREGRGGQKAMGTKCPGKHLDATPTLCHMMAIINN